MPIPFIMPKMDMDQEFVTITSWLKNEGDRIEKGESVIEIETDKIASEIEAPESGILAKILYHENEEAPVTKVVAYILKEGESLDDLEKEATPASKPVEEVKTQTEVHKTPLSATPLAEKVAANLKVDIEQVPASGNKITRKDVESYAEGSKQAQVSRVQTAATPAARRLSEELGLSLDSLSGSGPRQRVQASDVLSAQKEISSVSKQAVQKQLAGTSVPFVGKRKRIAERLTASYQSTPHIFLTVEVDMSKAEESRHKLNDLAANNGQANVSMTAYLTKVVAWALSRHPYLNATLKDDGIHLLEDINIGIATALDDGLIVPVVRSANYLSISQINEQVRYLSSQARNGNLTAEEVSDGTFTISNLGMFGIQSFTAIINPPQSAILAVGGLVRKPVVINDEDDLEVRPMMSMTLGADHRIVDGAVAAKFLADLVRALEAPELLLY